MAKIDHSNTILIVKPVGPAALNALRSERNTSRLVSFHFEDGASSVSQYEDPRSRECTPYVSRPPEIELHLKFHPKPKDPTRGFVFGTDDDKETEKKCDVVLSENPDPDPQKKYGISRQHFCIDFNWKSGFLRLNNISRYGTGMRAPSIKNGQRLLKSNTMHMLHPAEQTRVQVGSLAFDLFFPERGIHQRQYELNWEAFAEDCGHAVPNLGGLGIEPQRDITRFLVRRESRYNTYFFHDEIGKGEFGSVCKASDHRTAELFAAKQFTTRKPGWDARAYLEIAISQKVTHVGIVTHQALELLMTLLQQHIVSFVDSIDDGGGPVLVMEYMPLGNLTELDKVQKISLEEMRTVLRQALQALAYLHDEKNITHRDLKPENILVRSRTPELFIKICDFGLSAEKRYLMTRCGTKFYAAAEMFTGFYTNAVDIWAMGVLGYQFIKGLPNYSKTFDPNDWSKMIRQTVDSADCQGNDPVLALLKRMLELKPMDRPSAMGCLSDPWIGSATPLVQSRMEQTNVRPRSLEMTSKQPTEIWNPPTQLEGETPDPTAPGVLRKRLRSSESINSRTQLSRRGVKKIQVHESPESNGEGFLAGETDEHDRGHRLTRGLGRPTRTPHVEYERNTALKPAGKGLPRVQTTTGQTGQKAVFKLARPSSKQALPSNEDVPKVTEFDARHVQMIINGQLVLMRKEDGFFNATQIITLAKRNDRERRYILKRLNQNTKVEVLPGTKGVSYPHSWINFEYGRILCKYLGLEQKLQPLLDYGRGVHDDSDKTAEEVDDLLENVFHLKPASEGSNDNIPEAVAEVTRFDSEHVHMRVEDQIVLLRITDCFLNATQIIRLAEKDKNERKVILHKMKKHTKVDVKSHQQGSWVNLPHARILCKHLGLERQLQPLLEYAQRLQSDDVEMTIPIDQDYLPETGDHQYIAVPADPGPVMVRTLDFKVNATQILKVAGQEVHQKQTLFAQIRRRYPGTLDSVRGRSKFIGTYVCFDVAMDLCRKYGLAELESRIRRVCVNGQVLRKTLPSEGIDVDAQSSDVAGHIGASFRSDSALPQYWREAQQTEPMSSPDNSDSEDDQIQGSDSDEEDPVSDTSASKSSLSSSKSSTERENEHSSARLEAELSSLSQDTPHCLRQADSSSRPAKISYYKSCDYEPQYSRLSMVKPDLKPPSGTASPYESFTDIC